MAAGKAETSELEEDEDPMTTQPLQATMTPEAGPEVVLLVNPRNGFN